MFEKFKEELEKLSTGTENWAGKLANLGNTFKVTQDPILRFVRNIGYGRLGLFRFINNAITNLEMLSTTLKVFTTTFRFTAPIFNAIGGAAKAVGSFRGLRDVSGQSSDMEKLSGFPLALANGLDSALNKQIKQLGGPLLDAFKKAGILGVIEEIKTGGFKNIGRLLLLILGPLKIVTSVLRLVAVIIRFFMGTFMAYVYSTVGAILIGIAAVAIFIGAFWDGIKAFWEVFGPPISEFVDQIFTFFGAIYEGILGIFQFAFGEKSFEEMAFGLLDAAFEGFLLIVDLVLKLAVPLALGIVAFAVGFIASIAARTLKYIVDTKGLGLIPIAAAIALFLYGGAFAVAIGVGAFIVARWFWERATAFFSGDYLNKLYERFVKAIWEGIKSAAGLIKDMFSFMHTGGIASGGPTIVGERGPELLQLPRGARVHSNGATKRILSKGGGSTIINNITINARDTSDGEMRRIADKISSMVNNKINRSTSSRTLG